METNNTPSFTQTFHNEQVDFTLQNMFLLGTCITVVLMEHGLSCNPWKSSSLHELQQKGRLTLDAVIACLVIWKSNLHASSVSQYSGCSLTRGMKVGNPCIVHSPSLSPSPSPSPSRTLPPFIHYFSERDWWHFIHFQNKYLSLFDTSVLTHCVK